MSVAGGTPTLTLNDGGVATYDATATAALGDAKLVAFSYTVGANDRTQSLQVSSVNLNGAAIANSTMSTRCWVSGTLSEWLGATK